jgi:DNA-binding IclR family transcriptional regulator
VNTVVDQRVLRRIRAEYLEMPGMKLRIEQVQRLCAIEPTMCKLVLDALVKVGFLSLRSDGSYVRLTEGSVPVAPTVKAQLNAIQVATKSRHAS